MFSDSIVQCILNTNGNWFTTLVGVLKQTIFPCGRLNTNHVLPTSRAKRISLSSNLRIRGRAKGEKEKKTIVSFV